MSPAGGCRPQRIDFERSYFFFFGAAFFTTGFFFVATDITSLQSEAFGRPARKVVLLLFLRGSLLRRLLRRHQRVTSFPFRLPQEHPIAMSTGDFSTVSILPFAR